MSSASNASSPASDGATQRPLAPLAPSSTNGLAPLQMKNPAPATLLTQKEWVIPPRPKPGRKPATDTPPTKRKAQNRAAQRAFRERRAAKVGELEEQMREMEEEDEREQNELRSQIFRLEGGVKDYERLVNECSERMRVLEQQLAQERNARAEVQRDLARYRGEEMPLDVVPLAPRKKPHETPPPVPEIPSNEVPADEAVLGCGKCTINTRCECFERAVDLANLSVINPGSSAKRQHSPFQHEHEQNKRLRYGQNNDFKPENELEIDFTTRYAAQSSASAIPPRPAAPTMQGFEGCGFCQDGTTCICAEIAEDAKASAAGVSNASRMLSGPSNTNHTTINTSGAVSPPPPYNYYAMSVATTNPCANGPGTCGQCQSSPTSTLFCKALAATRSELRTTAAQTPTPCNSGSSAPCGKLDNCCRSHPENVGPNTPTSYSNPLVFPQPASNLPAQPIRGPTLSCADTYITLSRHPCFDRAGAELGSWLPKLATVSRANKHTPLEIEAASVMGVLKYFDRRFGRGG
ncbi:hypothetical protein MMC30_005168 [Trapelia coarctata]|nr:hypothetical protein [Trapelia coarctata]